MVLLIGIRAEVPSQRRFISRSADRPDMDYQAQRSGRAALTGGLAENAGEVGVRRGWWRSVNQDYLDG